MCQSHQGNTMIFPLQAWVVMCKHNDPTNGVCLNGKFNQKTMEPQNIAK